MRVGNGLENNAQGLGIQPHYQVYFSIVLAAISYHGQDVFIDRFCDLPGERAYRVDIDLESRWGMGGADAGERNLLWEGHGGCMSEEMAWARAVYIYLALCDACSIAVVIAVVTVAIAVAAVAAVTIPRTV